MRAGWIIAFLALTAGCRSPAALLPIASHSDDTAPFDVAGTSPTAAEMSTDAEQPEPKIRPVVFVDLVDDPTRSDRGGQNDGAQEDEFSLLDLQQLALDHNPTLAAAAARMQSASGRHLQAGLYPNPTIGYHGTQVGNLGTAGGQGAIVTQRLITAGKRRLDQTIAGRAFDETHFRFHAQELRILSDVEIRFYNVLVAQQRLRLTADLARIGDDVLEATRSLLRAGLATENHALQAEIRADQAHILLDNAEDVHIEAWRRLAAVIGTPTMKLTPLAGDLDSERPILEWDACHTAVMANHPELNAAQTRVQRMCLAVERAKREPIPNVDLSVSLRHQNVTQSDVANVQVGIPFPVFDKNQGNIRAAQAEWRAANAEVQRVELELQDRLAIAYRRYTSARQQVQRYRQRMVPAAKKSLEIVLGGYEKRQVEYLTLLTAQQTNLEVNLSYLDSLREVRTAEALINGQLLSDSLKSR